MSAAPKVTPIRIVNGFTAQLPGRARIFFQRVYFAQMPRPIQMGVGNAYPRNLDVATIEAPQQQCIILRSASFKIFQHSGIGVDDFIEVNPSRAASTFGFSLRVGNRGLTDFNTNNSPSPVQLQAVAPGVKVGVGRASLSPGDGSLYPFAGRITPNPDTDPFASYVRPGEQLLAQVSVLREPNYDVRFFSVEMSGWLANEAELDKIVNSLTE